MMCRDSTSLLWILRNHRILPNYWPCELRYQSITLKQSGTFERQIALWKGGYQRRPIIQHDPAELWHTCVIYALLSIQTACRLRIPHPLCYHTTPYYPASTSLYIQRVKWLLRARFVNISRIPSQWNLLCRRWCPCPLWWWYNHSIHGKCRLELLSCGIQHNTSVLSGR